MSLDAKLALMNSEEVGEDNDQLLQSRSASQGKSQQFKNYHDFSARKNRSGSINGHGRDYDSMRGRNLNETPMGTVAEASTESYISKERSPSFGAYQLYQQKGDLARDTRPLGHIFKTRMTCCDVIIGFFRPWFYLGIAAGVWYYIFTFQEDVPAPYLIGILAMVLYYLLLRFIWRYVFGLVHIGTFDELQLYDKSTNKTIITASLYFSKFNADLMLENLKARMLRYKTLRSKFVKLLDQYYMKEMSEVEIEKGIETSFMRVEKDWSGKLIKEEADLTRFLEREVTIPFKEGGLFFKIFVVENYNDKESVLLFKCHHALADGMALMGLVTALQDQYYKDQLYEFAPNIGCCKKIFMYLSLPLVMIWELLIVLFWMDVQKNALTMPKGKVLSGEKHGYIEKDWDVNELKIAAKKYGAGFNDFMMAMISVSLHRFFVAKGDAQRRVRLGLPASFRKVSKTAESLDLSNDLCPLFIDLNLNDDFDVSLQSVKAQTRRMRNSLKPYGLYYLTKLMAKVPMSIYLWVSNYTTRKITIVFSNVAGPKTPIVYDGFQCTKMAFLLPAFGDVSCGLSLISIGDKLKVGMLTDKNILEHPKELIDILDQVRREVLNVAGQLNA